MMKLPETSGIAALFDLNLRYLEANQACRQNTPIPDLIGRTPLELLEIYAQQLCKKVPEDIRQTYENWERIAYNVIETGQATSYREEVETPIGNIVYDVFLIPAFEDGKVTSLLSISQDVGTASNLGLFVAGAVPKNSSSSLANSPTTANVSRMIAAISHELKNDLNVIKLASQMIDRKSGQMDKYIQPIQMVIAHMEKTLEHLMVSGKLHHSGIERNSKIFDIYEMAYEQVRLHQIAQPHTITLIFEGLDKCYLDPFLIKQVLTNLLGNAIKYSPRGGEIVLTIQVRDEDVKITMSDQGMGIPLDDQARLFETFQRGSNISGIKGFGIGLSIVLAAIRAHDGEISCTSVPGQGTTFYLQFKQIMDDTIQPAIDD